MKTTLASAVLIISLLGARLNAADTTPVSASIEAQFQQADIQLALEQYKRLRMAAFETELSLNTQTLSAEQRQELQDRLAYLQVKAAELRAQTTKLAVADHP